MSIFDVIKYSFKTMNLQVETQQDRITNSVDSIELVDHKLGVQVNNDTRDTYGGGLCQKSDDNMVEYHTIIGLLTQASSLGISCMIFNLDSQLVVCQLNRIQAIRNPILLHLHLQVRRLERMFDYIEYKHIPRELNNVSDSLSNNIMDRYLTHR